MTIKYQEVDLLISNHLFKFIKSTIEKNKFELFKKEIHETSIVNMPHPGEIQNNISFNLVTKVPFTLIRLPEIDVEFTKKKNELKFLLEVTTIKDFNSVEILLTKYEDYENFLMKCVDEICSSEERLQRMEQITGAVKQDIKNRLEIEINEIIGGDRNDFFNNLSQIELLYSSLVLHFTFYRLGALIIFKGKQNAIKSASYINEMWDHTRSDDAGGINLNETPVQFDPLFLTYLHFYGGRNQEYWTKTSFGLSWGYDDFHGAEAYLYQYYLLLVTKCIQRGNSVLALPKVEDLNNLRDTDYNRLVEWYQFSQLFQKEVPFFLDHCDVLISESQRWDHLFKINSKEALLITKRWIQAYAIYCKELTDQITKRMVAQQGKIALFLKLVIDTYNETSMLFELAEIKKYSESSGSDLVFCDRVINIGNLEKRWFFDEDNSNPDQIFTSFGRSIALNERVEIYETVQKNNLIESMSIKEKTAL